MTYRKGLDRFLMDFREEEGSKREQTHFDSVLESSDSAGELTPLFSSLNAISVHLY